MKITVFLIAALELLCPNLTDPSSLEIIIQFSRITEFLCKTGILLVLVLITQVTTYDIPGR